MGAEIATLDDMVFDVVVIGGGINGTSAAQHLAADGYSVLLVDKGDFGSGASSRSARMLHPGLRYFEAKRPLLHFGLHPRRFFDALQGARQLMRSVSAHLKDGGDRIWPYRMCFPIYADDDFKAWHVRAGIQLLQLLGNGKVSLDFEMIRRGNTDHLPFYGDFRDPEMLSAIACYNEFKFDWPERFCIDMAMDAERNGAELRTYCAAKLGEQGTEGWFVELTDNSGKTATVTGRRVLNLAGTWSDDVMPDSSYEQPIVTATKGVHLVVELPDIYAGHGIASLNRLGLPYYITPLHGNQFSIGVTETPFTGDASNVRADNDDIAFLLDETNHILPGLNLTRAHVLRAWAGVRPLTQPERAGDSTRIRKLHDLTDRGFPGVYALTSGAIITHRDTGRLLRDAIAGGLSPSGQKGAVDHTPFAFSSGENSPPFLADEPDVRICDLEHAVAREHGSTLADVLERRTGLVWRRTLSEPEIERAAGIIGAQLGWDNAEKARQIAMFETYQEQQFGLPGNQTSAAAE